MMFFGGIDGFIGLINSLMIQENTGIKAGYLNMTSIIAMIFKLLGCSDTSTSAVLSMIKPFINIVCLLGSFLSLFHKEKWKSITIIVLSILLVAGTSHTYMLSFVIIGVLFFLDDVSGNKWKFMYLILFIALIAIIPLPTGDFISSFRTESERFTSLMILHEVCVLSMFLLLFAEGLVNLIKLIKMRIFSKITKKVPNCERNLKRLLTH
jgi:hypothetical protein